MRLHNLVLLALLSAGCAESIDPAGPPQPPRSPSHPLTASSAASNGIALDQWNVAMNESGTMIIQGFNPNPHVGDAIIATFFWLGSSNIIDSVTDLVTASGPYTPVGNKYQLVEYVSAGGKSEATYVALDVQKLP